MNVPECVNMVVLAGEQAAPNLLPARYFKPQHIYILHTDFAKSRSMAANLALRLKDMNPQLISIEDYDIDKSRRQILNLIKDLPSVMVNITGGTKPMSIAALEAALQANAQAFYVRSQGAQTEIDLYDFDPAGIPFVERSLPLDGAISIEDYLVAYFGDTNQFTGFGTGPGELFERALHDALLPIVDEIKVGWKHKSGAVDVDLIIRCKNQIGLIEAKTGKKALTTDGIKQLAVAGGQRFFGTYVKRFLIVDQEWSEKDNNRNLAEAIGIMPVELPGFAAEKSLTSFEQQKLASAIHGVMGKPLKLDGIVLREP